MVKKTKPVKAPEAIIDSSFTEVPESPPPSPKFAGVFTPEYGFTVENLVRLLQAKGVLNSGVFSRINEEGNCVDDSGAIVISKEFMPFYRFVQLTE